MKQLIMFAAVLFLVAASAALWWYWPEIQHAITCRNQATVTAPAPATATEVFNLQDRCAQLGENILNANVIGSALTQSQVSRYNQKMNRCYVELTVQSADLTKLDGILDVYLFDGQTKEMLAWDKFKNNNHVGMIFNYRESMGRNDALMYIDKMMRDD